MRGVQLSPSLLPSPSPDEFFNEPPEEELGRGGPGGEDAPPQAGQRPGGAVTELRAQFLVLTGAPSSPSARPAL